MHAAIDIHTHVGQLVTNYPPLKPQTLLRRMDRLGIEKAVVLAVENPEEVHYCVPTREVLRVCRRHPDRLIPFCVTDPRHGVRSDFDAREVLRRYVDAGCRGFGEYLAGLAVDDPRSQRVYAACQELGLPVLLHLDSYINWDRVGLPGFQSVLRAFPDVPFIAHGPAWWAQISADATDEVDYPKEGASPYVKGPVVPGGPVEKLLAQHPNLYADLSAQSAYNALSRDPVYATQLLERFQDKILFGTDYLYPGQPLPIVRFLENLPISETARAKILRGNAERLLDL